MTKTIVPMDFNTLCQINNGWLKLSNYYMDYAFRTEGIKPEDGMKVTFYDEGWVAKTNDIICFDGVLKKNDGAEPWSTELIGRIYTHSKTPTRKHFSAFIGASSNRMVKDGAIDPPEKQHFSDDTNGDVLAGIACFALHPKSELPNLSSIVGMSAKEVQGFFDFSRYTPPELVNGKPTNDTIILRGGSNKFR